MPSATGSGSGLAWVALSGGVDSAVAAVKALDHGYEVVGVTMVLGADAAADSSTVKAASAVAADLGIEHRVIDMSTDFEVAVVAPFVTEYESGRTPNPCVWCNDRVKFGRLLDAALEDGARCLVTGHYARIGDSGEGPVLLRGVDRAKDQSYFLYRLVGERLRHLWFPLGELEKDEVRSIARKSDLAVAESRDSQDVCFVSDDGVEGLMALRDVESRPGDIVDEDGVVLGRHDGVWRFTVGQRKGIGIGGGGPLYVLRIDALSGEVVVGSQERCGRKLLKAADTVWDSGEPELRVDVQVRYRMPVASGVAHLAGDTLSVELDSEVVGVAPGQSLVCYVGDRVVGGGYLVEVS